MSGKPGSIRPDPNRSGSSRSDPSRLDTSRSDPSSKLDPTDRHNMSTRSGSPDAMGSPDTNGNLGATGKPLPSGRLEEHFADKAPLYRPSEARAEANRCLYCFDAPCVHACPTAIDVPKFIKRIATGDLLGSARTILESNLLGYSCGRVCPVEVLCAGACVYNHRDQPPIQIGRLQRYAVETALASNRPLLKAKPIRTGRVALVGAGPASLSCAGVLALAGVDTVIYESNSWPGGLNTTGVAPYKMPASDALMEVEFIRSLGVRIEAGQRVGVDIEVQTLLRDHDAIFLGLGLGADRRLGIPGEGGDGVIGAVALIERLKLDPDAVGLIQPRKRTPGAGVGSLVASNQDSWTIPHSDETNPDPRGVAHSGGPNPDPRAVTHPVETNPDPRGVAHSDGTNPDPRGVLHSGGTNPGPAVEHSHGTNFDPDHAFIGNVLVIGGGNTAIDAARELAQLGAASVSLVYRRGASDMSAYAHEVDAAKTEGLRLIDHAVPVEVIREKGRVTALRIERRSNTSGMESPSSIVPRRNLASVAQAANSLKKAEDSLKKDASGVVVEDLPADLIVVAIGQDRLAASAALFPGVEIDARGRIVVDAYGRTGNPKIFAGGDCTNGGKEVVNAVADGKLAAATILESLPQRETERG